MEIHSREWHEARRQGIGGSDAAAVLGISPWKTRLELYNEKIAPVPDELEEAKAYQKWGLQVENIVAERYSEETGRTVRRWNPQLVSKNRHWERCHLDFYVYDEELGRGVLQIKTGMPWAGEDWAQSIPDYYAVQLQHEMMVSKSGWGAFGVLLGDKTLLHGQLEGSEHLDMPLHEEFVDSLRSQEEDFWTDHVLARVPPEPSVMRPEADGRALAALWPQDSGETIALGADIAALDEQLHAIDANLKENELEKERIRNLIRVALGENSRGQYIDGSGWTWKTSTRKTAMSRSAMFAAGIDLGLIGKLTVKSDVRTLRRFKAPKTKKGKK